MKRRSLARDLDKDSWFPNSPVLLVLPILSAVFAALWLRSHEPRGVPGDANTAPLVLSPSRTTTPVQGFVGIHSGVGFRVRFELFPLHAEAERQEFDRVALGRRCGLQTGEPWRLDFFVEAVDETELSGSELGNSLKLDFMSSSPALFDLKGELLMQSWEQLCSVSSLDSGAKGIGSNASQAARDPFANLLLAGRFQADSGSYLLWGLRPQASSGTDPSDEAPQLRFGGLELILETSRRAPELFSEHWIQLDRSAVGAPPASDESSAKGLELLESVVPDES